MTERNLQRIQNRRRVLHESQENIQKRSLTPQTAEAWLVENNLDKDICVHLHLLVGVKSHGEQYCLFIKHTWKWESDPAPNPENLIAGNVGSESAKPAKVKPPVLVNVAHVVEDSERTAHWAEHPNVIKRLQSLDDSPCLLAQPPNVVCPASGLGGHAIGISSVEGFFLATRGECGSGERFALLKNGKVIDRMVESRTQIIDQLARDDRPTQRYRPSGVVNDPRLSALSIELLGDAVRLTADESCNISIQLVEVLNGTSYLLPR